MTDKRLGRGMSGGADRRPMARAKRFDDRPRPLPRSPVWPPARRTSLRDECTPFSQERHAVTPGPPVEMYACAVRAGMLSGCSDAEKAGFRATFAIGASPGVDCSARVRIRWPVSLPPRPSDACRSPSPRQRTVDPRDIARGEPCTPIGRCLSCRARNKMHTFAVLSSAPFTAHDLRYSVPRPVSGGWRLTNRAEPCRVVTSIMSRC